MNELADWPVIVMPNPDKKLASASPEVGLINLYLDQFSDTDPSKPFRKVIQKGVIGGLIGGVSYETTQLKEQIQAGIQEASHLHFYYLREKTKHSVEHRDRKFSPRGKRIENGPLTSFAQRNDVSTDEQSGNSDWLINYYSLLADEFAAHVVQTQYIKTYFPEDYKNGYDKYDLAVKANRRKYQKLGS